MSQGITAPNESEKRGLRVILDESSQPWEALRAEDIEDLGATHEDLEAALRWLRNVVG